MVGPLCAHGGSERLNRAALHVTKLLFTTKTLSSDVRRHSCSATARKAPSSAVGTGSEKNREPQISQKAGPKSSPDF